MILQPVENYTDEEWAKIIIWLLDGDPNGLFVNNPIYMELYSGELSQLRTLITYQEHYSHDDFCEWAKSQHNQLLAEIALSIHLVPMRRIVFMKCLEAYVKTDSWERFRMEESYIYDDDYPNGRGYPIKMKEKKNNAIYWFMYWFQEFLKETQ